MVTILHTADIHLDSPFNNSIFNAQIRQQDLRDTFNSMIDFALNKSADLVLISGDLFDNESVTNSTQRFLMRAFQRAADIPFIITPGNHDYYNNSSIYALCDFPQNVFIFKKDEIECLDIPKLNVSIYGFAATTPHCERRLLEGFRVVDESRINLMLFHGNIVSAGALDNYFPLSVSEIAASGLDYVALGHIHSFSGILSAKDTFYAYCGCPEGRGFDELGQKGFVFGTVGKKRHNLSFQRVSKRHFEIINVDITGAFDYSFVKEKIGEALRGADRSLVARAVLTGEVSCDFVMNLEVLKNSLDADFYIEIKDETTIKADIEKYLNEKTLRGLFVNNIYEKMKNADEEGKKVYEKALRYGLAALNGEEGVSYEN